MGEQSMDTIDEPPFPISDADKRVLAQTDEEYRHHTWEDLQDIIGAISTNF
jgi:hypothetical protein